MQFDITWHLNRRLFHGIFTCSWRNHPLQDISVSFHFNKAFRQLFLLENIFVYLELFDLAGWQIEAIKKKSWKMKPSHSFIIELQWASYKKWITMAPWISILKYLHIIFWWTFRTNFRFMKLKVKMWSTKSHWYKQIKFGWNAERPKYYFS